LDRDPTNSLRVSFGGWIAHILPVAAGASQILRNERVAPGCFRWHETGNQLTRMPPSTLDDVGGGRERGVRRAFTGRVGCVAVGLLCSAVRWAVAAPAPAPAVPPYALPWQLRPIAPATVLRSDTAIASYEDSASRGGTTIASVLTAGYRLTPALGLLGRVGIVRNDPPSGATGTAVTNPMFGVLSTVAARSDFRLALFLGVAPPLGSGGGNSPDPAVTSALRAGIVARAGLDNALFAVNDLVLSPGIDLAYFAHGFTIQAEINLLQLRRLRGAEVQADVWKTNLTTGVHVGYFVVPWAQASVELRYQRWLSIPSFVRADPTGASRDILSAVIGLRLRLKVGDSLTLRPGIAYGQGLDDPMARQKYHLFLVDLPVSF
jgi:hypothetical protein